MVTRFDVLYVCTVVHSFISFKCCAIRQKLSSTFDFMFVFFQKILLRI
jgi:hypothetical protein